MVARIWRNVPCCFSNGDGLSCSCLRCRQSRQCEKMLQLLLLLLLLQLLLLLLLLWERHASPPAACWACYRHCDNSHSAHPHRMHSVYGYVTVDRYNTLALYDDESVDVVHDMRSGRSDLLSIPPPSSASSSALPAGSLFWQWRMLWISHLRPLWFLCGKREERGGKQVRIIYTFSTSATPTHSPPSSERLSKSWQQLFLHLRMHYETVSR